MQDRREREVDPHTALDHEDQLNAAEGYDGPTAICNCCGCSCLALRLGEYFNAPDMLRTNYVAKVDRDKCVACGLCVDNCQMGALKLGTKLCAKNEEKPAEPQLTPMDSLWGKDKYNVDYRTNRSKVADEGTAPCILSVDMRISAVI